MKYLIQVSEIKKDFEIVASIASQRGVINKSLSVITILDLTGHLDSKFIVKDNIQTKIITGNIEEATRIYNEI